VEVEEVDIILGFGQEACLSACPSAHPCEGVAVETLVDRCLVEG
jgi:hypothetical protein